MRFLAVLLAIGIVILGMLTLLRRHAQQPFEVLSVQPAAIPSPLTKLWALPEFHLTERSGQSVTLESLKGKVWVADFFYTSCPGPCSMLTSRLSDLQSALGNDPEVRLVSVSSDPEKDTPEILKTYADRFKAGQNWLFLTGTKTDVYALANDGFKLGLAEVPGSADPITHSLKLALVDRQGNIRGFYEGVGSDDTKRLITDIQRLKALGE